MIFLSKGNMSPDNEDWSVKTVNPQRGEVNNTDYLVKWREKRQGVFKAKSEHKVLEVEVLEAGNWDTSDFDKGQMVMSGRLEQSPTQNSRSRKCSWSAVVSTDRKWCKKVTTCSRSWVPWVKTSLRAPIEQIAEKNNAGYDTACYIWVVTDGSECPC